MSKELNNKCCSNNEHSHANCQCHEHNHEGEHHHHECSSHDHRHNHDDCHEYEHPEHNHDDGCCSCSCSSHEDNQSNNTVKKGRKTVLKLQNLDCANCGAKIERQLNNTEGINNATVTFATKQLVIYANKVDLGEVQKICSSIEPDIKVFSENEVIEDEKTTSFIPILIGAIVFVLGILMESSFISLPLLVISYLILGGKVVLTALKNITKGNVFDENFLMSIATLGAFVIGEYPEAVGVMLFYRIGEYFEEKAVEKSRKQIMGAVDLRPEVVNLYANDEIKQIPAADAKVGDILVVRPGDRIPLDGVIVDGESQVDTSAITGESVPVSVAVGDDVVSGCVNNLGVIKMRVERPLEDSMVTRILNSVQNAAANKPKLDRFITRFARIYTPIVVLIAVATAIIPSMVTGNWEHWIYTALTFLVISCPCALVLSVPLTFFSGIGAGSKNGILFKGGISLEALKNVKTVVMDKTGTITEGNFIVQSLNAVGCSDDELLSLGASCELGSVHPIGNSILSFAKEKNIHAVTPSKVSEIAGMGVEAIIDGKTVLCGNQKLMDKFHVANKPYDGYETVVFLAVNGKFIGDIVISDTIKKEAQSAISEIKSMGIKTAMLTGDIHKNAQAIADKLGIDKVFAKLLPQDKLSKLEEIRKTDGAVMFVGDGINDSPVLANADVGAAMGSGADAAIEAADVVFMTSSVEAIPKSIKISRKINSIAIQNVVFALAIKFLVMILGLAGYASMWTAVFADSGVAVLCVLNSIRVLYDK